MSSDIWGNVPDWFTAAGAIGTAVVAVMGVRTWRKQLIGENEYRVSVRLQTVLFDLDHLVWKLRNVQEYPAEKAETLNLLNIAAGNFEQVFKEARAHWGENIRPFKKPIVDFLNSVNDAVKWEQNAMLGVKPDAFSTMPDLLFANAKPDESDDYSKQWAAAVLAIETFAKQYIKP